MSVSIVSTLLALVSFHSLAATTSNSPDTAATGATSPTNVVDRIVRFSATDSTPLEGKLSLPADAKGKVPVVFYLHGAGPRTVDDAVQYRDASGQIRTCNYFDFFSSELASRGVAFFRVNKRGCTSDSAGRPTIDWSVFSKATPSVLLDDYAKALDALRERTEVSASQIVLLGSSEGTRLAPWLATRSPDGLAGLVLMSFQSANQRETVVWQNTAGPWRNIQKLLPAAADGQLTRAEFDAAVMKNGAIARVVPFDSFDSGGDGTATREELSRLTRQRLDVILKAVDERNDDLIGKVLLNLSSAYLLDDWDGEPTHVALQKLGIPISIYHGELDGTTSIEGVREAERAFRTAGKTNLIVNAYPGHDHDLNWTIEAASRGGPAPFHEAFDFVVSLVRLR
jgi:pimeloyl-ACP methyl ester carboxylesterase